MMPRLARTWALAPAADHGRSLVVLCLLIAILSAAAAVGGLAWQAAAASETVVTARGDIVELYGRGLYRHDSLFVGAGFVGQDWVTLLLGVPALLVATFSFARGSFRGTLLLTAVLGYFLYAYASMALGAAYNELFLVYVAVFSASLFALFLAARRLEARAALRSVVPASARYAPAVYLFAAGGLTFLVWSALLVTALLDDAAPARLDAATTKVTEALDLGIIAPAAFVAGGLILSRRLGGYLIALPLLGLIIMLVPVIAAATVSQIQAGVRFTPGEIIGPLSGFLVLGGAAVPIMAIVLRTVEPRHRPGRRPERLPGADRLGGSERGRASGCGR
jgi:hypothetical protein